MLYETLWVEYTTPNIVFSFTLDRNKKRVHIEMTRETEKIRFSSAEPDQYARAERAAKEILSLIEKG